MKASDESATDTSPETSSEDALNVHQKRIEARARETNAKRVAHMKLFQAKYQKQQQVSSSQTVMLHG